MALLLCTMVHLVILKSAQDRGQSEPETPVKPKQHAVKTQNRTSANSLSYRNILVEEGTRRCSPSSFEITLPATPPTCSIATHNYVEPHHKPCRNAPQNTSQQTLKRQSNGKQRPNHKQKPLGPTSKFFFCTHTNSLSTPNVNMNVNSKFIIYLNRNRQSMQSSALGDSPLMQALALTQTKREQLQVKMRKVFQEEMKNLNQDMQSVLADDIVTAFLNRIGVFLKIEAKTRRYTRTKRILNP